MSLLRRVVRACLRPWRPDAAERLRRAGVRIGQRVSLQPGVVLDESHGWLITIGDDVTLAPRVVVLAHDASTKRALGFTRVGRVDIGDRTFVGGNSVILPGVRIGSDCVIGAGSVLSRDVPDGSVAAGNPARVLGATADYLARQRARLAEGPRFGRGYTQGGGITPEMQREMRDALGEGPGFVE